MFIVTEYAALSPVHTMKLLSADKSFMVCTSDVRETLFKRFLWLMKLFQRIGHCSISWNLSATFGKFMTISQSQLGYF